MTKKKQSDRIMLNHTRNLFMITMCMLFSIFFTVLNEMYGNIHSLIANGFIWIFVFFAILLINMRTEETIRRLESLCE